MSNSVVEKRRFGLLAHPDPWQKIEICMRELADMLKGLITDVYMGRMGKSG
jgi:hypothetical protein